ncbi:MAG: conjugal transfer protein [Prevotella sp.]|uniref:cysteine-rich KTR domain-containing protein n=1 Tax=Clostridium vitabionis TaxID=2784388 RepID=UPI00188A52F4|nr:cysteine-rich KTR domain-containing protein [Clostridium vitabionis]MBR3390237.1 conjugal transfer protein [Prevotella sp.]
MYKCRSMLMLRIDGKTRVQVFYNTVLRNFPLFCPKCKLTHIVDVEKLEIIIKNSEKQTF